MRSRYLFMQIADLIPFFLPFLPKWLWTVTNGDAKGIALATKRGIPCHFAWQITPARDAIAYGRLGARFSTAENDTVQSASLYQFVIAPLILMLGVVEVTVAGDCDENLIVAPCWLPPPPPLLKIVVTVTGL